MPYITDVQLRRRLQALLKQESDLDETWDDIITQANATAYQDILSRLIRRGYTKSQVDGWARRVEFSYHLAFYWAFVEGAGLHDYSTDFLDRFDRRQELETVKLLDADGQVITVGNIQARVGRGDLCTTEDKFSTETKW